MFTAPPILVPSTYVPVLVAPPLRFALFQVALIGNKYPADVLAEATLPFKYFKICTLSVVGVVVGTKVFVIIQFLVVLPVTITTPTALQSPEKTDT
jgi:hypothetical protein